MAGRRNVKHCDADGGPIIHIAAALIDDGAGRLLLVRKAGSRWFMQAGGKIEPGEPSLAAVIREVREEIGLILDPDDASHLGCFVAPSPRIS
ncbi:NUDIX hydrolase [Sphingomonas crocodyli]|uniref:NUDIX hydrolase n=1 Tax=Sphingomonas crocodyli TaxID=1979270 RepID=UPI0019D11E97|nr:NUDIX domain-containing protein [Sphingomonas crocodyli]